MSYPILFAPGTTDFSGVGIGVLKDATDCKVREVLNGEFELSMTYPVEGELMSSISKEAVIAVKMRDRNDYQGFRIFSISKPLDKNVTIEAEHVSYKLAEIPLKNFSAGGIQEVLNAFHSHVVEGVTNPFTFNTNFINSSAPELITYIPTTIRDVMGNDDGMMLSKEEWKNGEWKFDNWTISFLQNRGSDKSASICYQYGSNVASFNQDEDLSNTVTAVFPYWHTEYTDPDSDTGTQVPVNVYGNICYASGHDQFANERIAIVDVDEYFTDAEKEEWEPDAAGVYKPTAAAVTAKGQEVITKNKDKLDICKPHVSLTVDPVELSSLVEYSDISKEFEQVNLGDIVSVHFADYNIDTQEKIIEIEYDVLRDINTSVTIGDPTPNLASTIADIGKAIEENRAGMVVTRDSLLLYVKTEAGDLATQIEMTEDRIYQKVSGNPSGWNMVPITGDASATGGEGIDISFYNYGDPDTHYEPGLVYNNQYYFDDETGAVWKCQYNSTSQEYDWVQPTWTRDHGKVARGTDTQMQAAADLEHYMFSWYNTTDDIIYVCERYADATAPGGFVYYWTAKEEGPDGDAHIQLTGELMYAERADIYSYSEIESQANQIVLKVNSAGHMVQVALAARAGLGSEFNVMADNINFDSYTFNLATDRININSPGFKVTPQGYMTANDGKILGDFEVDGAFFMINLDELEELISYGVFDQTGFTIYKPCDENDVGAVALLRKDDETMYYNQKVVMSIDETGAGWSMEDRSSNAITRLRGNNLCVSQIYTNDWAPKEDAYVDDGSAFEGFKAWLSMNPRWFGMYHKKNGEGSQLNDYRLGHFFGDDVSDTVELIDEWWDGDSNPKNPDEAMFLMESPTDKNNNFLMAVFDQIIMAGSNFTSKQSPRQLKIRNKQDPNNSQAYMQFSINNKGVPHPVINVSDYFDTKSPYRINTEPMYKLVREGSTEADDITPGTTALADGCFLIVYDGPAREAQPQISSTITIKTVADDVVTITDEEGNVLATVPCPEG